MTSYATVGINANFAVNAVTYELRIVSINIYSAATSGNFASVDRYDGGHSTGGTQVDIVPLRQGAPAASATAYQGFTSVSGAAHVISEFFVGPGASRASREEYYYWVYTGNSSTFESSLPFTVPPGSALVVGGLTTSMTCNVTFEEIKMPDSY